MLENLIFTMTRKEIITKLTPIVREMLQDETLNINDEMSPANVTTWTSMSFMMMLKEIENQFGIEFKMMEILRLQNMGAIIAAIEAKTNA